jgi:hypothetical protein
MQSKIDKSIIFPVPNYKEALSSDLLDRIRKRNLKVSKEEFKKILGDC